MTPQDLYLYKRVSSQWIFLSYTKTAYILAHRNIIASRRYRLPGDNLEDLCFTVVLFLTIKRSASQSAQHHLVKCCVL